MNAHKLSHHWQVMTTMMPWDISRDFMGFHEIPWYGLRISPDIFKISLFLFCQDISRHLYVHKMGIIWIVHSQNLFNIKSSQLESIQYEKPTAGIYFWIVNVHSWNLFNVECQQLESIQFFIRLTATLWEFTITYSQIGNVFSFLEQYLFRLAET